jgi:hypothetical protein
MCLGRLNIMNRRNQSRKLNFYSYRTDLEETLTDLEKMRDADAVSHWLLYRVSLKSTGLHKFFQLETPDLAVCKARTAVFVNALIASLRDNMPSLKQVAETEEGDKADPDYGNSEMADMYKTWLQVPVCLP